MEHPVEELSAADAGATSSSWIHEFRPFRRSQTKASVQTANQATYSRIECKEDTVCKRFPSTKTPGVDDIIQLLNTTRLFSLAILKCLFPSAVVPRHKESDFFLKDLGGAHSEGNWPLSHDREIVEKSSKDRTDEQQRRVEDDCGLIRTFTEDYFSTAGQDQLRIDQNRDTLKVDVPKKLLHPSEQKDQLHKMRLRHDKVEKHTGPGNEVKKNELVSRNLQAHQSCLRARGRLPRLTCTPSCPNSADIDVSATGLPQRSPPRCCSARWSKRRQLTGDSCTQSWCDKTATLLSASGTRSGFWLPSSVKRIGDSNGERLSEDVPSLLAERNRLLNSSQTKAADNGMSKRRLDEISAWVNKSNSGRVSNRIPSCALLEPPCNCRTSAASVGEMCNKTVPPVIDARQFKPFMEEHLAVEEKPLFAFKNECEELRRSLLRSRVESDRNCEGTTVFQSRPQNISVLEESVHRGPAKSTTRIHEIADEQLGYGSVMGYKAEEPMGSEGSNASVHCPSETPYRSFCLSTFLNAVTSTLLEKEVRNESKCERFKDVLGSGNGYGNAKKERRSGYILGQEVGRQCVEGTQTTREDSWGQSGPEDHHSWGAHRLEERCYGRPRKRAKSGVTGISWHTAHSSWRATFRCDTNGRGGGTRLCQKSFSTKVYGTEGALALAIEWRNHQIRAAAASTKLNESLRTPSP